ncbi:agmatine deiminase family protein [Namhaeicola litoreus]|uniref:Agmatine/peptidylarginine deiminase n=1 Tax=Namhaeicola litoreus TaxID=1052145 RepID=A0ABW3Y2J8_9FLAO
MSSKIKSPLFYVFLFVGISIFSCKSLEQKETISSVRFPGEFEKQESIWLIWPTEDHIKGMSNEEVSAQIILALHKSQKVNIAVADEEVEKNAKTYLANKSIQSENISFKIIPSIQMWIRDMGPNFVISQKGEKEIVDFNFNSWGYAEVKDPDNQVEEKFDEMVAKKTNLKLISSELISEGGNRESNGEGVLMTTESVELGRNPGWTKKQIEAEFQRTLGINKVIWLKEGVKEDDHTFKGPIVTKSGEKAYTVVTTNGHIDEFARFVNDHTILLAEVDSEELDDPIALENHRRLEENYKILKEATDQDGKPFEIIRIPMPKTILGIMKPGDPVYDYIATLDYQDGSSFPTGEPIKVIMAASYLNFLIANEVVLMQKYYSYEEDLSLKETDEKAKKILESLFPMKKVIAIDASAINFGGGGIHCITMQEPAAN